MKEKLKSTTLWRIMLIILAIAFIFIGLSRKENDTVFIKAVNICLECIGIG